LTITVNEPMSIQESMKKRIEDWFNPLNGVWATITTIATGIKGWQTWKRRK
jgi:hypothetical protein